MLNTNFDKTIKEHHTHAIPTYNRNKFTAKQDKKQYAHTDKPANI
jgi:hypothetical protein